MLNFKNKLKWNSNIEVPVILYKGIHVMVNNKSVNPYLSKRGWLQFNLPNSKHINIKIWFTWTPLAKISQFVYFNLSINCLFYNVWILKKAKQ